MYKRIFEFDKLFYVFVDWFEDVYELGRFIWENDDGYDGEF